MQMAIYRNCVRVELRTANGLCEELIKFRAVELMVSVESQVYLNVANGSAES